MMLFILGMMIFGQITFNDCDLEGDFFLLGMPIYLINQIFSEILQVQVNLSNFYILNLSINFIVQEYPFDKFTLIDINIYASTGINKKLKSNIIKQVSSIDIFEYLSRLFILKYNKIWTFSRIRSSMFQTIIQFSSDEYPFDTLQDYNDLKLQTLIQCKDSTKFVNQKKKFSALKTLNNPYIIKLQSIYQQSLIIHLIFEHVSESLKKFIHKQIQKHQGENSLIYKKLIIKQIAVEVCQLTDFLVSSKILTTLSFQNIGVNASNSNKLIKSIKYFLGTEFAFTDYKKEQLQDFYLSERKKILSQVQKQLQFGRRSDYLPNYIIRGNKIIFTDDLSETKTKKKSDSPPHEKFQNSGDTEFIAKEKKFGNYYQGGRHGKTGTKAKKIHKYSCNFEQEIRKYEYQNCNEKLNKSFEQDPQNYSITQTKSMKIEVEHQKPTTKCRKNSVKFKITTFQQISIDKSVEEEFDFQNQRFTYPKTPQNNKPARNSEQKKDYRQKVSEAKQKAQAILQKYLKTKNKAAHK